MKIFKKQIIKPITQVSIQRRFTILFLVVSIVPMVMLYYLYLQNVRVGRADVPDSSFSVAMIFMALGVLVGYFSIRSLLVRITDISEKNRTALKTFLSPEIVKELSDGENEIEILGRSFTAATKQLERDIQDLKKKNDQLKALDRLKDEFVSMVSHEFRLPLAIIQESLSHIEEGMYGQPNEQQAKYLNMCLRNIERLGGLIDNLLDLSKIEEGKLKLTRDNIDLVELAKEVALDITPRVKAKGLQILTRCSSDKIEVYADKDKIIQVFMNLLGNAYKFTQRGSIEISVKEKEGAVECSVTDTGIGIAEQDLPHLFSKFFQAKQDKVAGEKGTGLGLVICKHIIELHNGRISVASVEGKGTSFTFSLPKRTR